MDIKAHIQSQDNQEIQCLVTVSDEKSTSKHIVKVNRKLLAELNVHPNDIKRFVKASFQFLLERESKESILPEFEIMDIAKYFPQYEQEIKEYFSR